MIPAEIHALLLREPPIAFDVPAPAGHQWWRRREAWARTMTELACAAAETPAVRSLAIAITQPVRRDWKREAPIRLTRWVRSLRYVPDPAHVETLHGPISTLLAGGGDCDDLATTLAALGLSVGLRWAPLIVWGADREQMHAVVLDLDTRQTWEACRWSHMGWPETTERAAPFAGALYWWDGQAWGSFEH